VVDIPEASVNVVTVFECPCICFQRQWLPEAEPAILTSSKRQMRAAATKKVLTRKAYWADGFRIMADDAPVARWCFNVLEALSRKLRKLEETPPVIQC
jgi:hypothetical protein